MREGGIVRMADGGRPPPALPGSFYGTSMADLEGQASNQDYEMAMSGIESGLADRNRQSGLSVNETQQAIADIRSRISSGMAPERALSEALPGYRRADEASLRQLFDLPPRPAASNARPAATTVAPTEASPAAPQQLPVPPAPPARPGSAGGIGAIRPEGSMGAGAGPAGDGPSGTPTIAQNMERNLALFPGIPDELMERIRASRINEGERRSEARRMALVEAGLRIAASRNPSLAGAIGEGAAPAVQSYSQQLSQIRQDQSADLTREMAVAQADLQRRYMAGQISAAELQRQTQMLEIAARERQSIRAEGIAASRSAASEANADARLTRQESAANAGREHTARMSAIRDVNKEVSDTMGDTMRREAVRSALRQAGQPAPTDAQILTALRRDAMNRIFPDYGLQIPATISDSARPGATVQSGVPR
jgi:hypothetical protein